MYKQRIMELEEIISHKQEYLQEKDELEKLYLQYNEKKNKQNKKLDKSLEELEQYQSSISGKIVNTIFGTYHSTIQNKEKRIDKTTKDLNHLQVEMETILKRINLLEQELTKIKECEKEYQQLYQLQEEYVSKMHPEYKQVLSAFDERIQLRNEQYQTYKQSLKLLDQIIPSFYETRKMIKKYNDSKDEDNLVMISSTPVFISDEDERTSSKYKKQAIQSGNEAMKALSELYKKIEALDHNYPKYPLDFDRDISLSEMFRIKESALEKINYHLFHSSYQITQIIKLLQQMKLRLEEEVEVVEDDLHESKRRQNSLAYNEYKGQVE